MRKSDHSGGLYDQRFEHDACGLGTVVHLGDTTGTLASSAR